MPWGASHGILDRPSVREPFPDRLVFHSETFAQFSKAGSDSTESHNLVGSSVPHLFFVRNPTAVARLVISVVVDAVNLFAWRLLFHVLQKVFKDLPSFAHFYSTSSVSSKAFDVWIRASGFHCSPNAPSFASITSPCVSVNKIADRSRFPAKASTRSGTTCHQLRVGYLNLCPTITQAKAHSVRGTTWLFANSSIRYYSKSCEFPPNQTESFRHNFGSINVVFSGGRPATTGARCDSFLPLLTGRVNA